MSRPTDTRTGPDLSGYLTYLRTNRDFTAPAVGAALDSITPPDLDRPVRVLDAGTGAGGALAQLAAWCRGCAGGGSVLAVDRDERAVEQAGRDLVPSDEGMVDLRVGDLRQVATEAARTGAGYDLVWASDVVWPATFDDPAEVVQELTGALATGGVLALFTTNYYQSMLLPGHSRLERLIRTASELTWGLPDDGPAHYERLGAWMRQAGLADASLRVFPLAASTATDPLARAFAEQIAWPEMRHAVASHGRAAGMSEADLARAEELLDPDSPAWVGVDPDAFIVQPTLLWTGRAR